MAALTTEGSNRSPEFFRFVARLYLEAAEGLTHAHGMGVLHRDIKPANLLVDGRCSLWITDFGLAQMRSDALLTRTGELVGTLRYMSPSFGPTGGSVSSLKTGGPHSVTVSNGGPLFATPSSGSWMTQEFGPLNSSGSSYYRVQVIFFANDIISGSTTVKITV
jgi:serine/threonine protein kinase